MTIEVVLISGALIWGVVELVKHLAPSYYDRVSDEARGYAHKRIDELEKKIAEMTGGAK